MKAVERIYFALVKPVAFMPQAGLAAEHSTIPGIVELPRLAFLD
jgi:hypothetical protein